MALCVFARNCDIHPYKHNGEKNTACITVKKCLLLLGIAQKQRCIKHDKSLMQRGFLKIGTKC